MNWPPRPVVEDEADALAREHLAADIRAFHLASSEPPFRGTVDQHPIILESSISLADATKLHSKLHAECKAEDSGERRFVLIPRSDTHSPIRDDDEAPRRSCTAPKTSKSSGNDTEKRNLGKPESSVPPLERRRSRQDLPSLQTEVPQFRRSTSAYAYTPSSKNNTKSPGTSGETLLSPDAATYRAQSKGYFDIPKTTPRSFQGNIGATVTEKRRSAGPSTSRPATPITPVLEKGNSAGSDAYPRLKQDLTEKLTRPQQLSTERGARRSERAPSTHSHLDPSEQARQRKGSSQPSRRYYSSSDEDHDSSDSDRRRRRHHRHHRHQNSLRPDDDRDLHHRSVSKSTRSSEGKPGSRNASPLVSPNISPSQLPPTENSRNPTLSSNRENRRPVSPLSGYTTPPRQDLSNDSGRSRARSPVRSRRSSPVAAPGTRTTEGPASSTLPITIPTRIDLHSPSDSRHSPSIPQYVDDRRSTSTRPSASPSPSWQPPPLQPASDSYLDRPTGSYRRYSQDIDDGNIAPLPPCPRTTLTRGYKDWLTLPQAPEFNICPSCYESTIAPTEFHGHFVAAPTRPSHEEVICDFGSQPWYRIAWLLTRKERRRDLTLMSSLAKIAATTPPCLGKHEAVRKWYSIVDPDTGHPVRNFDVCLACVKSIDTLLPALKGVFVRTDQNRPPGLPRICDMRFDSKRFIHYFDAFETAADLAADSRYLPDTTDLADLVKRYAALPECPRDQTLSNSYWYIITQLPEFTVCPECFDEVVHPALEKGKAIPAMFNKAMQRVGSTSCQLYSPRMRAVFRKAVDGNDYKLLAAKARERMAMEVQCKKEAEEWKRAGKGEKEVKKIEGEWAKWE